MEKNKIAIVCDSSVSFTPEEITALNVYIAPLTISHGSTSYVDQVTITEEGVNDLLRKGEVLKTSQPSIGLMIDIFEDIKSKDYGHVIVLSIGTALSGSYAAFQHAVEDVGLENATVINTYSICGPVQQGVRAIRRMEAEGQSIETILKTMDYLFSTQVSYIYPENLRQVVASGRMSKTAASIATLLKVRPVIYLENKGASIEKLGISRTERKAFQILVDDFIKNGVTPDRYDVYLLESEGMETLERFKAFLFEKLGTFTYHIVTLPAAVATHAGLGTISVQWCPKV